MLDIPLPESYNHGIKIQRKAVKAMYRNFEMMMPHTAFCSL